MVLRQSGTPGQVSDSKPQPWRALCLLWRKGWGYRIIYLRGQLKSQVSILPEDSDFEFEHLSSVKTN